MPQAMFQLTIAPSRQPCENKVIFIYRSKVKKLMIYTSMNWHETNAKRATDEQWQHNGTAMSATDPVMQTNKFQYYRYEFEDWFVCSFKHM